MENAKSSEGLSKGIYWILFLVSLVAIVLLLMYASNWFWVALPFVLTFLVKAMDVI